jgi:hypothetical protein
MNKKQLLYLSGVISADKLLKEETENYMFFQNLKVMKSCIDELLDMNESDIDAMLSKGHDWANNHVSVATTSLEQVCNWIKNSSDKNESVFDQLNTSKFEFTIPKENLPKLKRFLKSINAHVETTPTHGNRSCVDGVITKITPGMEGGEKTKEILQSIKDAIAKAKKWEKL